MYISVTEAMKMAEDKYNFKRSRPTFVQLALDNNFGRWMGGRLEIIEAEFHNYMKGKSGVKAGVDTRPDRSDS